MKKLMVLMVFVAGFMFAGWAEAAGGNSGVNPLTVARAFSLKTPDHYRGYLSCEMLIGNSFQRMEMEFTMVKDFSITSLSVNGNQISLSEPIYGLPMGDGGLMRNVYLNICAMTKNDEYAGSGYLQEEAVSKGDNLLVTLTPADLKREIEVDVAQYGTDIQLVIENFIYGYGWGVEDGKFYAFVPPVGGRYHYILRRWSDGLVIGEGWLEPFKPTVEENDTYVGVTYLGNVIGKEFSNQEGLDDWIGINNVSFDCQVPTDDGSSVMGKVIFTDAGLGGLEIICGGDYLIYVQSATGNDGDMPLLELEDHSYSENGWSQTRVNTVNLKAGKVVITIIPKPTNTRENPWLNLHRYYGSVEGGD